MKTVYTLIFGLLIIGMSSCSKETPSIVYMPDMYYPVAYDPLQEATLAYSDDDYTNQVPLFQKDFNRTALYPVDGTVYRNSEDILPMELENTTEDYMKSVEITTSPLDSTNKAENLERGKKMYELTCTVCHGVAGDGQGDIVKSGAFSGVPNYKDRQISVGSVYYVIMHGKNLMGSYAGQLTIEDRWRVAEYVMELKNK